MNVNIKRIRNTLFLTLLAFSLGTFCVFPITTSKYVKIEEDYLKYSVDYKVFSRSNIIIEKNTDKNVTQSPTTIGFVATFNRSDYLKDDDKKVKYTFSVNKEACEITGTSPSSLFENSDKNNVATLTLNSDYLKTAKTKQIKVYYKCNADDIIEEKNGVKYLSTNFKVTEEFNNESKIYNLGSQSLDYAYELFYNLYPHMEIDENGNRTYYIPKDYDVTKRYDLIVNNFIIDPSEQIYFKQKYPDTDKTILETDQALKGFSISESVDGNYYAYTTFKNYHNYAYTNGSQYLYFIDTQTNGILSDEEINILLREYLFENISSYYSQYTDERKEEIISYVENVKPSIKSLLETKTNGELNGISYNKNSFIIIMNSIIDYIDLNKPIEFNYTDSLSDTVDYLNNRIGAMYSSTIRDNIIVSVFPEINAPSETEKYTYLGPFEDGNLKVIALLHAIPGDNPPSTGKFQIKIFEVEENKEYELSFVSGTTTDDINAIIAKFESDTLVVSSRQDETKEDGTIVVKFTMIAKSNEIVGDTDGENVPPEVDTDGDTPNDGNGSTPPQNGEGNLNGNENGTSVTNPSDQQLNENPESQE